MCYPEDYLKIVRATRRQARQQEESTLGLDGLQALDDAQRPQEELTLGPNRAQETDEDIEEFLRRAEQIQQEVRAARAQLEDRIARQQEQIQSNRALINDFMTQHQVRQDEVEAIVLGFPRAFQLTADTEAEGEAPNPVLVALERRMPAIIAEESPVLIALREVRPDLVGPGEPTPELARRPAQAAGASEGTATAAEARVAGREDVNQSNVDDTIRAMVNAAADDPTDHATNAIRNTLQEIRNTLQEDEQEELDMHFFPLQEHEQEELDRREREDTQEDELALLTSVLMNIRGQTDRES